MEPLTVRHLPFAIADGPQNMAADETLLQSAARGVASFRCYGWSEPTVSLGYFQPHHAVAADERLRSLAVVRRPSGGKTLVHHHELTYALALPATALRGPVAKWLVSMHSLIARALAPFGVRAQIAAIDSGSSDSPLCFRAITRGDLLLGSHKIAGSAQRRHHGALLQHGAILLQRSQFTPTLPGLAELAGVAPPRTELAAAVARELLTATGWELRSDDWTAAEIELRRRLADEKYGSAAWTRKR